ncbi:MAG: hypothetical protein LUG44_05425 [Clostridiales bacterium]|nr:hypothetical protein [Clostridiales bacterium]
MSKCKILITADDPQNSGGKVNIAASGYPCDIVVALADALVCVIENSKKDGKSTDVLAYKALTAVLEQREHNKITVVTVPAPEEAAP